MASPTPKKSFVASSAVAATRLQLLQSKTHLVSEVLPVRGCAEDFVEYEVEVAKGNRVRE